jgi:pimeloyl-ACP methyl ester carboxylesterase
MEFIITDDNTKIYYKIQGCGTPVILVHGFTATHDVFRVLQKLLSKNHMAISYDLRGHGLSSESSNITLGVLAQDLRELIEKLELKNIILVGWSLGASVIFEYIKRYGFNNIMKLSIIDSSPKIINDKSWDLGLYHGKYYIEDALEDLNKMISDWNNYSEEFMSKMAPELTKTQLRIAIEAVSINNKYAMIDIWKSLIYKDYRDILKEITIPALLMFGGKSTLYSTRVGEYLKSNIKESGLIVFEQNTHLLVQESPIGINRALKEFI